MRLSYERRSFKLSVPLVSAHGTVTEREVLYVTLIDGDGSVGYGEAAPLESYDGIGLARVEQALDRYRAVLEGTAPQGASAERAPPRGRAPEGATTQGAVPEGGSPVGGANMSGARLIDACRSVDDLPEAFAAVEMALWDRAGRRAGKPVCALLTDAPARSVPVNATLSAVDRASAAEQAAQAAAAGFGCLKIKVGVGDDAGRVAAVRAAAGPEVALRLDANGAWDVEQAVRSIEALAPAGLELVEEPVHGLAAMREVRARVATRVSIDETAAEHGALTAGVADAVCLKVSRCGGISGLLAAASLVRATGAEAYVASTLDGPLGVAAALHAAAALASRGPLPACGLATLGLFEECQTALAPKNGQIAVPPGEGLGVSPQLT